MTPAMTTYLDDRPSGHVRWYAAITCLQGIRREAERTGLTSELNHGMTAAMAELSLALCAIDAERRSGRIREEREDQMVDATREWLTEAEVNS